jgi:sugar phosphate isomerase/epimerase
MIFGSGRQRSAASAAEVPAAIARLRDGLAAVATHAASRNVTILLEPLAPQFSNVVNTLEEAVRIIREIDSPAVRTMFDTHNSVAEPNPHTDVLRRYWPYIRHIHLNEMDGRRPGTGAYPFRALLRFLADQNYGGWLSVEVFEFKPDGETVAREAYEHLNALLP